MKGRKNGFIRNLVIMLIALIALFACGFFVTGMVDRASASAEENLVQEAVRQAMITCYAVEGAYPADIEYLKANYGLGYNEEEYFVYYDAFASNILPEIHVSRRGTGK